MVGSTGNGRSRSTTQGRGRRLGGEGHPADGPRVGPRAVPEAASAQALADQALQIHVHADELVVPGEARGLGQHAAVLADEGVVVEGQIGAALAGARGHVDVGALAAVAGGPGQQAAQLGLAHGEVAGGQVADHRGPGAHLQGAGGHLHPVVLADLHAHRQAIGAVEQQIGADKIDGDQRRIAVAEDLIAKKIFVAVMQIVGVKQRIENQAVCRVHIE